LPYAASFGSVHSSKGSTKTSQNTYINTKVKSFTYKFMLIIYAKLESYERRITYTMETTFGAQELRKLEDLWKLVQFAREQESTRTQGSKRAESENENG